MNKKQRIEKLEKRVEELEREVEQLQARLDAMPNAWWWPYYYPCQPQPRPQYEIVYGNTDTTDGRWYPDFEKTFCLTDDHIYYS